MKATKRSKVAIGHRVSKLEREMEHRARRLEELEEWRRSAEDSISKLESSVEDLTWDAVIQRLVDNSRPVN